MGTCSMKTKKKIWQAHHMGYGLIKGGVLAAETLSQILRKPYSP